MDGLVLLLLGLVIFMFVGAIVAFAAMARAGRAERSVASLLKRVGQLAQGLEKLKMAVERLERHLGVAPAPAEPETRPPEKEPEPVAPETPSAPDLVVLWQRHPPLPEPSPEAGKAITGTWRPPAVPAAKPRKKSDWGRFEEIAGKQWMTWVGVLVLFLSAGFFLKHAFDNDWIGPPAQVAIAIAAGIVLAIMGAWFSHKDMRALGQGLIGGGLMILYGALFAAFSREIYPEPVIESQKLVFALMCIVTVAGMTIAVRQNALPISFLAVLGGFLTPVLVSTGVDARDALFSYILLLDLAVLGVAFYKKWRPLDILAFVGTMLMFAAWYEEFYRDQALTAAMGWLIAFYLVFLIMPFAHHLRRGTVLTVERFVMALANATFAFSYAYRMLHADPALSWVALWMAGCYLTLGVLTRMRIPDDVRALFGFITLALTFLTLFVPLRFGLNGITLAWTAEACALAWLGFQFAYRPVRIGGFLVLLLAVGRVFWKHWPTAWHAGGFSAFANTEFYMMMCAPAGVAIFAAIHQFWRGRAVEEDRYIKTICTIGAGLLALTFVHVELEQWLVVRAAETGLDPAYLTGCSLTALWALGAACFLAGGWRGRFAPVLLAGVAPLAVAIWYAVNLYTGQVDHAYWLCVNGRFGVGLLVCGVLFAYALACRRATRASQRSAASQSSTGRPDALVFAGYAALLLANMEIFWWVGRAAPAWEFDAAYVRLWSLTALWSVGAGVYVAIGSWRKSTNVQWGGLIPVGVAMLLAIRMYVSPLGWDYLVVVNERFGVSLVLCAVLFAYGRSCRRMLGRPEGLIAAGYAALLLVNMEIVWWIREVAPGWGIDPHYTTLWLLAALWALGAGGYLVAARRGPNRTTYWSALVPLGVAWGCGLALYSMAAPGGTLMFVNPQFGACLLVCGALFACALGGLRRRADMSDNERSLVRLLWWTLGLSLLALLSAEPARWVYRNIPDPQRAGWTAQMSVSIVWSVYASGMLAIGFWRRILPLRLAALALFAVTAAKLVVVDMANVRQIYRIISFFVLGFLMIGASYLYHKAEKRLHKAGTDDSTAEADQ